jgi:D-alanyl-D-alanine carboxypeptidase
MSSPLLQGGRRRRHRSARLAFLAIGLAALAVAAGAWLALGREEGGEASVPIAAQALAGTPTPSALVGPLRPEPAPAVGLDGIDAFRLRLRKPPRAGLVFDLQSGEVLWRLRPRKRLPIASLTKIMTALVVTERAGPNERVRVTPAALRYSGSGVGVLPKGRRLRLEILMNGLMLVSGNDAAIALAVHVAGRERRFVRLMNDRARQLGLRCTRFASSHGLEPGNRSCAADLAVMARLAMAEPRIARIARRRQAVLRFPIKGGKLYLSSHNPLLRIGYAGTLGLKTGYTNEAGRCFVGVARHGGRTLGVVLLGSPNPARHAPKLLDLGFRLG